MTRNDRLQDNLERLCADGERRFGKPGASFGAAAIARSLPLSHATSRENARKIYESGCLKPLSTLVAEGNLEHRLDRVELLLGTSDSVFFYVGVFSYPATACGFLFSAAMEEAHREEGSASPFDSGGLVKYFDWPKKQAETPRQFLERHELPIPGHRRYLDLCLESLFAGPEGYFAGETITEDPIGLQGGDAIRRRLHEVRIPARIDIRTPHLRAVFAPANLIAAHLPLRSLVAWCLDNNVDYRPFDPPGGDDFSGLRSACLEYLRDRYTQS